MDIDGGGRDREVRFAPLGARPLEAIARLVRTIGAQESVQGTVAAAGRLSIRIVPGTQASSVVVQRRADRFRTMCASAELAGECDAAQNRLSDGPCLDALSGDARRVRADDLRSDDRWPRLAELSNGDGVRSVLSVRLETELDTEQDRYGLNLYSRQPAAFDESSELALDIFAAHASAALRAAVSREQVLNLHRALQSNRDIGVAMGILMAHRKITRMQAYDLLRRASQHSQRKLAAIAIEVADTGILDFGWGHDALGSASAGVAALDAPAIIADAVGSSLLGEPRSRDERRG
ncbi:MAG: ANTAR domain-containing protein [Jatrophihabitantaceae bacterium]